MRLAAAHIDSWIFLLLVAVAMFFRWLTSLASNKGSEDEDGSAPPPPVPRAPAQTDEERIRKFLEALGQPAGTRPPPPVAPRQMDAERAAREARQRIESARRAAAQKKKIPRIHPNLPPLTTVPPPLPVQSPLPAEVASPAARSIMGEGTIFEVRETADSQPGARASRSADTNIMALLKSPAGLRNAIVLREVFGPPRSLQPMDLV